jgi:large subunit ribosomal protein L14e
MEVINMFEIGRICVKLAGRDAGKKCVVIDAIDSNFVLVDGQTRRKRCNMKHLEPLNQLVELNKNAPAAEVARALKELGIDMAEKKASSARTQKDKRPRQGRKQKAKPVKQPVKPTKAEKAKAKKQEPVEAEAVTEKKAD